MAFPGLGGRGMFLCTDTRPQPGAPRDKTSAGNVALRKTDVTRSCSKHYPAMKMLPCKAEPHAPVPAPGGGTRPPAHRNGCGMRSAERGGSREQSEASQEGEEQ